MLTGESKQPKTITIVLPNLIHQSKQKTLIPDSRLFSIFVFLFLFSFLFFLFSSIARLLALSLTLTPPQNLPIHRNVPVHWVLGRGFKDKDELRNKSLGLKRLKKGFKKVKKSKKIKQGEIYRFRRFFWQGQNIEKNIKIWYNFIYIIT